MEPLFTKNLKEKSAFRHILQSLSLTVWIAICTSQALAQGAVNSASAEDNTLIYAAVGVLCAALIGFLIMRSKSKVEKTADEKILNKETNGKRNGAKANPKTGDAAASEPNKSVGGEQNDVANAVAQTGKGVAAGNNKLKAINYVEFDEYRTKQPTFTPSNGNQSNLNNLVAWQITPPAPFEDLPRSEDDAVLDAVEQIFADDNDKTMLSLAIRVLSTSKTVEAVEGLQQIALNDSSAKLKIEALIALGAFDHQSVFEPILLACADSSREVRAAAARMLTRLSFNRADAFVRIINSQNQERMCKASKACVESGFANRAFERLTSTDPNQSYEAFTILSLLVKAGEFEPIVETVAEHPNMQVRLATIKILHNLSPHMMAPAFYDISRKIGTPPEVKTALDELLSNLNVAA